MQKPTNLVQGDLFPRVIRIYSVHDYQIQSGNFGNHVTPGTPC